MSARDAATRLFRELTGRDADGVWSAPGRVNLIGEHTDYNDGFVLPFATPHRTYAAVGMRDDERIRVASTFAEAPVEAELSELESRFPIAAEQDAWAAYPLGVAWALRLAGASGHGVDIAIASDVPVGAGLSSSAAIEGATASALNELWDAGLDRTALASIGRRAENEAVGAPTGIMDQMASMLGEADAALFLDCRSLEAQIIPLGMAEAGLAVLVIDTRVAHAHSTGGYRERRASCEKGAAIMDVAALRDLSTADLPRAEGLMDDITFRRVRHIVTENQRVLDTVRALREHGARAIGDLLTASHASMRDDFEISCAELDTAVQAAVEAGALGARMTGGGFGGSAIALVEEDTASAVTEAVTVAFGSREFRAPDVFSVSPGPGARQEH